MNHPAADAPAVLRIHADFSQSVELLSEQLPWVDSPMAGVQRRMLYREGNEVAKATTIVRYAPQSYFSPHRHGGGEEFYVLEGVFSDEHGDYPSGSYVRNPVGSSHRPHSVDGCTILVRLWQMDAADQNYLRVATGQVDWQAGTRAGEEFFSLHQFAGVHSYLLRQAQARALVRESVAGEDPGVRPAVIELFVLEGPFQWRQRSYPTGAWLRHPNPAS